MHASFAGTPLEPAPPNRSNRGAGLTDIGVILPGIVSDPPSKQALSSTSLRKPTPEMFAYQAAAGGFRGLPAGATHFDVLTGRACLRDALTTDTPTWSEIESEASRLPAGLGISVRTWAAACERLGRRMAAVAVVVSKPDRRFVFAEGLLAVAAGAPRERRTSSGTLALAVAASRRAAPSLRREAGSGALCAGFG